LNIDKALLSAKNFNIYDPMRKGQGLVLDGQTLAHIEVRWISGAFVFSEITWTTQVLMNSDGNEEGTLLKLIGRCVTPFGKPSASRGEHLIQLPTPQANGCSVFGSVCLCGISN
jgi:DNA mismatch repair protein MSH6